MTAANAPAPTSAVPAALRYITVKLVYSSTSPSPMALRPTPTSNAPYPSIWLPVVATWRSRLRMKLMRCSHQHYQPKMDRGKRGKGEMGRRGMMNKEEMMNAERGMMNEEK